MGWPYNRGKSRLWIRFYNLCRTEIGNSEIRSFQPTFNYATYPALCMSLS